MTTSGTDAEDLAKLILLNQGFLVDQANPERRGYWENGKRKYEQTHDRFGCFDHIAVHPITGHFRFIQVTHPSGVKERKEKIKDTAEWPTAKPWITVELWSWQGDHYVQYTLKDEWKETGTIQWEGGGDWKQALDLHRAGLDPVNHA